MGNDQKSIASVLTFSNGRSSPERSICASYPVYGSNGIIGFSDSYNSIEGSIIIGRVGSYCGSLYYSPKRCWITDNAIKAEAKEGNEAKYLYYLLSTLNLNRFHAGSGQPLINQSILSSIEAYIHPLPTQKAIAHILGTLDDKIELLRSMNETLEAMARALFKSWFIDFDPVRKKAEGQPTGLPPEIDSLFPDSFMDSELGEIPKGWSIGTIGAFCTAVNEQVFPEEMDGTEIYVGLEHIPRKSITLTEWDKSEDVQSNKSKFKQEDVLFGKLRPYFHKVVFAPVDGLCSTDILVIRSRSKEAKTFILMHLSSVEVIEYATGFSNGTKMPRTNWKDLSNFKIVSPPPELLSKYEIIATEKLSQLKCNTTESSVLASLRASLLPKLISGEIELSDKDISKILEPAK